MSEMRLMMSPFLSIFSWNPHQHSSQIPVSQSADLVCDKEVHPVKQAD